MKRSLLLTIALAVLLWFAGTAVGATFTVNTTADTVDANPGDGTCADSSGACSLRAAIMEANALGGSHTIVLQSGQTYTLTRDETPGNGDMANEDDLDITSQITIQGNGATIQRDPNVTCTRNGLIAGGEFRIFHVLSGGNLTLQNLTVKNGCADGGSLPFNSGGGILVNTNGQLTITNSTISGNSAYFNGGGIYNNKGTVQITNSTISDNEAYFYGGGIFNYGTLTITGSTISGNSANYSGGGIFHYDGTLTITAAPSREIPPEVAAAASLATSSWRRPSPTAPSREIAPERAAVSRTAAI